VVLIPTTRDNSIRLDRFEAEARKLLEQGRPLGAIVASMGTTDAFGLDDLKGMVEIRDQLVEDFNLPYRPHIHADAVIGWAWRAFQDYDFEENPLGFRGRTLRALAAANYRMRDLGLADSIGIDFHKTGYTPYVSSMFLVRDQHDFGLIARRRETMPYLYQSGEYHPGMFTLETSRSGTGPLGALANLLLFGRQGMRSLLGHVVEMAEVLREQIQSHHQLTVLNGENVGPVTLFRAYPPGIDTFTVKDREFHDAGYREQLLAHNDYNRRIFQRIHGASLSGRGVALSMTECYRQSDDGQPIAALKSYVMSPFTNEQMMADIVQSVLQASHEVDAQRPSATPDETLEQ
jgi:glutamate/tyrosine decarboxylase-like PLP-dependent enzyme